MEQHRQLMLQHIHPTDQRHWPFWGESIFRATDPFSRESTGHQWRGDLMFALICAEKMVEQTIETQVIWDPASLSLWRHCNEWCKNHSHEIASSVILGYFTTCITQHCFSVYKGLVLVLVASLAFVRGIHWGPVNSPHKWPVTRKMLPFDDVIMRGLSWTSWLPLCAMKPSVIYVCIIHTRTNTKYHTPKKYAPGFRFPAFCIVLMRLYY